MKNTFFSILILSSTFIYSSDFNANITQKNERQAIRKHQAYSSILDEDEIDFEEEEEEEKFYSNDTIFNQYSFSDKWNILKGSIGLWFGINQLLFNSKGILVMLIIPNHVLLDKASHLSLSPTEKLILTNRFLWLSVGGLVTALSVWTIKKSIDYLYKGLYSTEDSPKYF